MKKKKHKKLLDKGMAIFHDARKCRKCLGLLEKSRWWECENCKPWEYINNVFQEPEAYVTHTKIFAPEPIEQELEVL